MLFRSAGTILLTVFLKDGLMQLYNAPILQVVNVIYLGFFPGAIAYLFWVMAISKAKKVTTVTNFMFITPLLSTVMGLVVIREVPSLITIIGGCIIVGGSILFQKLSGKWLMKIKREKNTLDFSEWRSMEENS